MSDTSSRVPQSSSASDLASLQAKWHEAIDRKPMESLASFFSSLENEECRTHSEMEAPSIDSKAAEAQSIVSKVCEQEEMQQQSLADLLSFYEENETLASWRSALAGHAVELEELVKLDLDSKAKLFDMFFEPFDDEKDQGLLKEVRRLARMKRTVVRRKLAERAKAVNEKLGLQGANAIKVPEVPKLKVPRKSWSYRDLFGCVAS